MLGYLIEGLAAGIINSSAHDFDSVEILDPRNYRVAAGNQQAHVGILDFILQVGCVEMSPNVVYSDKGYAPRKGKSFGEVQTN